MRLSLLLTLFFIGCQPAAAMEAACYVISSPDARTFCLAEERNEPSMCYAIIDGTMRAKCLAEVRR